MHDATVLLDTSSKGRPTVYPPYPTSSRQCCQGDYCVGNLSCEAEMTTLCGTKDVKFRSFLYYLAFIVFASIPAITFMFLVIWCLVQ